MGTLQALARRIGADERTLRRAVEHGAVRALRPSPRRLTVPHEEQDYLAKHWPLLMRLRRALRTEKAVRLAVLFGSAATGDASERSDVDLLVGGAAWSALERVRLAARLERAVGRPVHVLALDQALGSPSLFADVLAEGRVLVDRDGEWPSLLGREPEVSRAAARHEADTARRAAETVEQARARLR